MSISILHVRLPSLTLMVLIRRLEEGSTGVTGSGAFTVTVISFWTEFSPSTASILAVKGPSVTAEERVILIVPLWPPGVTTDSRPSVGTTRTWGFVTGAVNRYVTVPLSPGERVRFGGVSDKSKEDPEESGFSFAVQAQRPSTAAATPRHLTSAFILS